MPGPALCHSSLGIYSLARLSLVEVESEVNGRNDQHERDDVVPARRLPKEQPRDDREHDDQLKRQGWFPLGRSLSCMTINRQGIFDCSSITALLGSLLPGFRRLAVLFGR